MRILLTAILVTLAIVGAGVASAQPPPPTQKSDGKDDAAGADGDNTDARPDDEASAKVGDEPGPAAPTTPPPTGPAQPRPMGDRAGPIPPGEDPETPRDHGSDSKDDRKFRAKKDKSKKDKSKKNKRKKKQGKQSQLAGIEIGGRVFLRNTISRLEVDDAGWSNQLAVDSARLGVKYRNRKRGLRIEVEVEYSGGEGKLRDGYVRWQATDHLRLQAGQFKQPISAVALASKSELPVPERGLINDFSLVPDDTGEADELPLGGRHQGLQAQFRARPLDSRATLGVFRSRVHRQIEEAVGENRLPLTLSDGFPEDIYGRYEATPWPGIDLAASLAWVGILEVGGDPSTFAHTWVGGLDAAIKRGPLRLWLEAYAGGSPVHLGTNQTARGVFTAARIIAATRLGSMPAPLHVVEPFGSFQYMDVSNSYSADQDADAGWEAQVGVNLEFARAWRLQTAYEHRSLQYLLGKGQRRLIVQVAAVF